MPTINDLLYGATTVTGTINDKLAAMFGSQALVAPAAAAYTVLPVDRTIICDTDTYLNSTVTLPSATGSARIIVVKAAGSNGVTITAQAGEWVDVTGDNTYVNGLAGYQSGTFQDTAAGMWRVV
jgi:hypothetical protein